MRLTGRSRALEIITSGQDYDAETAALYGWVNRAVPDAELDAVVDELARRLASFDREALRAVKEIINQEAPPPNRAELVLTNERFAELLARGVRPGESASLGQCQPGRCLRRGTQHCRVPRSRQLVPRQATSAPGHGRSPSAKGVSAMPTESTLSQLKAPNLSIEAGDGITYRYRRFGRANASNLPLLCLVHFRANLDNWD